jgi:SAM-dependent methyltransferase
MTRMTRIFGDVADMYDDVRPGYPAELATAILDHHRGTPASVVEVGAGTGKGTDVVVRLGAPVTCVEPDPRMSAVLQARFPQVTVVNSTFEQWSPTASGVSVVACAMAWHWLDEATRNRRVHDVLAPGGTLAAFTHRYDYVDTVFRAAVMDVFHAIDYTVQQRPIGWPHDDIAGSGLFTDVETVLVSRHHPMSAEHYLQLIQTFSPFRTRPPAAQQAALDGLRALLADSGDEVTLDLRTSLVLARRPDSGR